MFEWVKRRSNDFKQNFIYEKVAEELKKVEDFKCTACWKEWNRMLFFATKIYDKKQRGLLLSHLAKSRMEYYKKMIPIYIRTAMEDVDEFDIYTNSFRVNSDYLFIVPTVIESLGLEYQDFEITMDEYDKLYSKILHRDSKMNEYKGSGLKAKKIAFLLNNENWGFCLSFVF